MRSYCAQQHANQNVFNRRLKLFSSRAGSHKWSAKKFQTDRAATLKARQPMLGSLWCCTATSFWQKDRRCLRDATSATLIHSFIHSFRGSESPGSVLAYSYSSKRITHRLRFGPPCTEPVLRLGGSHKKHTSMKHIYTFKLNAAKYSTYKQHEQITRKVIISYRSLRHFLTRVL